MDRLIDLVTFLFQETRPNRLMSGSKNHHYTVLGLILIIIINLVAYFLSAFYGSWIITLCMGLTFVVLVAKFGIPLIANLTKHDLSHRPLLKHRHPLEEHPIVLCRFRVLGKPDQTTRKRLFYDQKKRRA